MTDSVPSKEKLTEWLESATGDQLREFFRERLRAERVETALEPQPASNSQFTALKALRISRQRVASLHKNCEDSNTTAGLDELYQWLDAVIDDVLPSMQPAHEPEKALLSKSEVERLLESPTALEVLADMHDFWESCSDGMDMPECAEHHRAKRVHYTKLRLDALEKNGDDRPAQPPREVTRINVPTHTMEQEFQSHYRRGYEAGKQAATQPPFPVSKLSKPCAECGAELHIEHDSAICPDCVQQHIDKWIENGRRTQPPGESHLAFLLFHVLDELEKYEDFTRQEVATHLRSELQRLGLTKEVQP